MKLFLLGFFFALIQEDLKKIDKERINLKVIKQNALFLFFLYLPSCVESKATERSTHKINFYYCNSKSSDNLNEKELTNEEVLLYCFFERFRE